MAGAGFVIFKRFADGIKFLGLIGPDFHQLRCHGIYDIPKGVIDNGEKPYAAAKREAHEETGYVIEDSHVVAGPFVDSMLMIWMAEVTSEPIITPNPDTGILEHYGYHWLTPEELLGSCYNYLRPTLRWATMVSMKM